MSNSIKILETMVEEIIKLEPELFENEIKE